MTMSDIKDTDNGPAPKVAKIATTGTLSTMEKERLFDLVASGHLKEFMMVKNFADLINDRDSGGLTYLHRCIAECTHTSMFNQTLPMLNYFLSEVPQLTMEKNGEGETALCFACKEILHHRVISTLIQANPESVNIPNNKGWTPLYFVATFYGQLNDKKRTNYSWRETPRDDIMKTSIQLAQLLVDNGADVTGEISCKSSINNVIKATLDQKLWYCHCKSNKAKKSHDDFVIQMLTFLHKNNAPLTSKRGRDDFFSWCIETANQAEFFITHYYDTLKRMNGNDNALIKRKMLITCHKAEDSQIIVLLLKHGLLSQDPELVAKAREKKYALFVIKALLEKHPDYDINSRNIHGSTIFIEYASTVKNIEDLIKLGADPFAVTNLGYMYCNAYLTATRAVNIQAIKKLLELKVDPLQFPSPAFCVLGYICRQIVNHTTKSEDWFELLKIILNHPEFQIDKLPEDKLKSIVMATFDELFKKQNFSEVKVMTVLSLIINKINNINTMVIECAEKSKNNNKSTEKKNIFEDQYITPFAYAIKVYTKKHAFLLSPQEVIKFLLKTELKINEIPKHCITPLTIFLYFKCYNFDTSTKNCCDVLEKLIQEGVNVESNVLTCSKLIGRREDYYDSDEEDVDYYSLTVLLDRWKSQYRLPDALLLAYVKEWGEFVKILLHYWWAPPLALVIFKDELQPEIFCELLKYGGIPHGTEMYQQVHKYLETQHLEYIFDMLEEEALQKYQQITNNPLSLQDLCKYVVRESLSEKASYPDTNLPELLHQVLPPLLRPVVLHRSM